MFVVFQLLVFGLSFVFAIPTAWVGCFSVLLACFCVMCMVLVCVCLFVLCVLLFVVCVAADLAYCCILCCI